MVKTYGTKSKRMGKSQNVKGKSQIVWEECSKHLDSERITRNDWQSHGRKQRQIYNEKKPYYECAPRIPKNVWSCNSNFK